MLQSAIACVVDYDQLTFSQSSRPVKSEEYQVAKKKGFALKQIPVAIDGIWSIFLVNTRRVTVFNTRLMSLTSITFQHLNLIAITLFCEK